MMPAPPKPPPIPNPTRPTPRRWRGQVDALDGATPSATTQIEQHQSESRSSTWSMICCTDGLIGSVGVGLELTGCSGVGAGPAAAVALAAARSWASRASRLESRRATMAASRILTSNRRYSGTVSSSSVIDVAGEEGGDGRADDDRVAPVACERLRRDDAGARGAEDPDGHLEDQAHREQHGGGELVVLVGLHEDVELAAVEVLEEAHGRRQHDEVAERHPDHEQERDRQHQRQGDASLARAERGQDEPVQLEQDHRQREDHREHEGDPERRRERLADRRASPACPPAESGGSARPRGRRRPPRRAAARGPRRQARIGRRAP